MMLTFCLNMKQKNWNLHRRTAGCRWDSFWKTSYSCNQIQDACVGVQSDVGWQPWLGSMTDEVLAASGQLHLCILNIYHGGYTGDSDTWPPQAGKTWSFIQRNSTSLSLSFPCGGIFALYLLKLSLFFLGQIFVFYCRIASGGQTVLWYPSLNTF